MKCPKMLNEKYKRLLHSLQVTITYLRDGLDNQGLNALVHTIVVLEDIIDTSLCMREPRVAFEIGQPLAVISEAIRNEDMTGLTDVLEFTMYPLVKKWLEGTETT